MKRLLILAAAVAAAVAALAAVPAHAMEINFGAVLTDQDGEQIMDCAKREPVPGAEQQTKCVKEVALTLGRAAFVALMTPTQDEQSQTADEKKRKGDVALTAYLNMPKDMSIEDVAMIKKYIAKNYGPMIVVRAFPLLDQPAKK